MGWVSSSFSSQLTPCQWFVQLHLDGTASVSLSLSSWFVTSASFRCNSHTLASALLLSSSNWQATCVMLWSHYGKLSWGKLTLTSFEGLVLALRATSGDGVQPSACGQTCWEELVGGHILIWNNVNKEQLYGMQALHKWTLHLVPFQ